MNKTIRNIAVVSMALVLGACSTTGGYQPLPPVKVITETVEVEIYAPPLPPEIDLQDVEWKVISNTPCRPATGIDKKTKLYTYERFQYEKYTDENGKERSKVVKDAEGNRIELEQLKDANGEVIQVCGNLEEKIYEVEKLLDGDFAVFAVTPGGYQALSTNLQEIKRYIAQQQEIIMYYREATKPKGKDGWLDENKERQSNDLEAAKADNNNPKQEGKPETSGFNLNKLIPGLPGSKD